MPSENEYSGIWRFQCIFTNRKWLVHCVQTRQKRLPSTPKHHNNHSEFIHKQIETVFRVYVAWARVFISSQSLSQCLHSGVLGSHSPRSITTFHPFNSTEKPYTDSSHFHSIRMHIYEFICSHWNHSNGILFSWYGRRTELNDIFTRKMFHSMRIRFSVGSFVRSLNR